MKCEATLIDIFGDKDIPTFGVCWHPKDQQKPCPNPATTTRQDWRFGAKGEPQLVRMTVHCCARCAKAWDQMQAEGAAEARAS
jgi:hypothetical protein